MGQIRSFYVLRVMLGDDWSDELYGVFNSYDEAEKFSKELCSTSQYQDPIIEEVHYYASS